MVETTKQTRAEINQTLMAKALEIFGKSDGLDIVIEKEDPAITGKLVVRQTWDGPNMVSVSHAVADGLVPADFKELFQDYDKYGAAANSVLDEVSLCETTPEGHKVIKMTIGCPWPLWNRMLINTFYNNFDQEDGS